MRCCRCGDVDQQPGVQPEVHVDTVTMRVNDTVELLRVPLCGFCRKVLANAVHHVLHSAGEPAA